MAGQGRLVRYDVIEDYENLINKLIISEPLGEILIKGKPVDPLSDRYRNFHQHGYVCCKCGLHVEFAAVERPQGAKKFHINLYGRDGDKDVLFTKDHIYPRALGGVDDVCNYQVMCEKCNSRKGDDTDLTPQQAIELGYTTPEAVAAYEELKLQKLLLEPIAAEYAKQKAAVDKALQKFRQIVPKRPKEPAIFKK